MKEIIIHNFQIIQYHRTIKVGQKFEKKLVLTNYKFFSSAQIYSEITLLDLHILLQI